MRIQELIENSLLHSLGLLEPDESAQFLRAFDNASPQVREHVLNEQARLAINIDWLPEVDPPESLRDAVISRVRAAMAAERDARATQHPPINSAVRKDQTLRRHGSMDMVPSRGVSKVWRASAIGLLTAAIVLGATTLQLREQFNTLDQRIRENNFTDESVRALGPGVKDLLLSGEFQRVRFTPSETTYQGQATLWFDPESRTAYLICDRLPVDDGRSYTLVVLNDEGAVAERLANFSSDGRFMQREVKLVMQPNTRLAILASGGAGQVSTVLLTPQL